MRFKFLLPLLLGFLVLSGSPELPIEDFAAPSSKEMNAYESEWKRIDSLAKLGLSQSVIDELEKLYKRAKKDENAPQIVKICIFQLEFDRKKEENHFPRAVEKIKKEIEQSSKPLSNVFHSILAEMYWWYFEGNRWKILELPASNDPTNMDIQQWDARRILTEIHQQYQHSLNDENLLFQTSVGSYDDIIAKGKNTSKLRNSLFEFLAFRALDFYQNNNSWSVIPSGDQLIFDAQTFDDAERFVKIDLQTNKSTISPFRQALLLYQKLLSNNGEGRESAQVDADLLRFKFLYANSKAEAIDSLYSHGLKSLIQKYSNDKISAEIQYELANFYFTQGAKFNPLASEKFRWEKKKAIEICEKAIANFPESRGSKLCERLIEQIKTKTVSVQIEAVSPVNKPTRILLSHQNLDSVRFRVVAMTYSEILNVRRMQNDGLKVFFNSKSTLSKWSVDLANDNDYQQYSSEIKVPGQSAGGYALLASDASTDGVLSSYATFWVSDISSITRIKREEELEFRVVNRNTGQSYKDVTIELYEQNYNRQIRTTKLEKLTSLTSDKTGRAVFSTSNNRSVFAYYRTKNDSLFDFNGLYLSRKRGWIEHETRARSFIFTDRSIYRPGQTIHLKGIAIQFKGENRTIIRDTLLNVQLFDQNSQKLASVSVKTNQYGSYYASFVLPSSALTGNFRISDGLSPSFIDVEEYKRPKFEVELFAPGNSYRLGSEASITGKAESYSGAKISNAQVNYRVVRRLIQPRYPWIKWSYFPTQSEVEISTGNTTTDEKGEFELKFTASPSHSIGKNAYHNYSFQVIADVVDISGESQRGIREINISKQALKINTSLKPVVNAQRFDTIHLSTENLSGTFQPSSGTVSLSKLQPQKPLLRKRYWSEPTKKIIPKSEYNSLFPNDVYGNEDQVTAWPVEQIVFAQEFNTASSKTIFLPKDAKLEPGKYKFEVRTKDAFGEAVDWVYYFDVFDEDSKSSPGNVFWFHELKTTCEPGEKASVLVGTTAKRLEVLYEVWHKGQIVASQILTLNQGQHKVEIPVEEKHRGNFNMHFTTVYDNRCYTFDPLITVPYTNKKLDLKLTTFRDLVEPGAKEKWKLQIKDYEGEVEPTEVLLSMYDASLDVFFKKRMADGHLCTISIINALESRVDVPAEPRPNIFLTSIRSYKSSEQKLQCPQLVQLQLSPLFFLRGNSTYSRGCNGKF